MTQSPPRDSRSAGRCRRLLPYLSIIVLAGILLIPMFKHCGLDAHDYNFHRLNSFHFSAALASGHPYPRWLASMNAGLGSPVMYYYGPLSYYISSFFTLFAGAQLPACSDLAYASWFVLAASGVAAYCWLHDSVSGKAAFVGAVVYMFLPYHYSIDLYHRFAFAELVCFALMPICLFFAGRAAAGSFRSGLGLVVAVAMLCFAHLPSTLLFLPLLLAYALVWRPGSMAPISQRALLILPILLGAGLAAVYWLPALSTREWVAMLEMQDGFFRYSDHFLFEGPHRESTFAKLNDRHVAYAFVTAVYCWLSTLALPRSTERKEAGFLFIASLLICFMMLSSSLIVWRHLSWLQAVQFPWRFQLLLCVTVAGLVAYGFDAIRANMATALAQPWRSTLKSSLLVLASLLFAGSQLIVSYFAIFDKNLLTPALSTLVVALRFGAFAVLVVLLLPSPGVTCLRYCKRCLAVGFWISLLMLLSSQSYHKIFVDRVDYSQNPWLLTSVSNPEHRPKSIAKHSWNPHHLRSLASSFPRIEVASGNGEVSVQQWLPGRITLLTDAASTLVIRVAQFHYPTWMATVAGSSERLVPRASDDGLIALTVPAGRQSLQLSIVPSRSEIVATAVSFLSLLLTLSLSIPACRRAGLDRLSSLSALGSPPRPGKD